MVAVTGRRMSKHLSEHVQRLCRARGKGGGAWLECVIPVEAGSWPAFFSTVSLKQT